jgi:small multidrug resistance pump
MKEFAYLYLALAIITEVIATTTLKATDEFSRLVPSVIVVLGYMASFYFMTLVLRTIPVGITYAVWSGVGIVLVAIFGAIAYKQIPDLASIIGMTLIIAGVVVIHVFSRNISH